MFKHQRNQCHLRSQFLILATPIVIFSMNWKRCQGNQYQFQVVVANAMQSFGDSQNRRQQCPVCNDKIVEFCFMCKSHLISEAQTFH